MARRKNNCKKRLTLAWISPLRCSLHDCPRYLAQIFRGVFLVVWNNIDAKRPSKLHFDSVAPTIFFLVHTEFSHNTISSRAIVLYDNSKNARLLNLSLSVSPSPTNETQRHIIIYTCPTTYHYIAFDRYENTNANLYYPTAKPEKVLKNHRRLGDKLEPEAGRGNRTLEFLNGSCARTSVSNPAEDWLKINMARKSFTDAKHSRELASSQCSKLANASLHIALAMFS
jgi:hypothetical protein